MINIIYGAKGSGKTQKIIERANIKARSSKGCVVYVTDCANHSSDVDNSIRFVDINRYGIKDENGIVCFIKGLLAGNYDITDVFVDGLAKFVGKDVADMEETYTQLDLLSSDTGVAFTLTVSTEEVPQYMQKYI